MRSRDVGRVAAEARVERPLLAERVDAPAQRVEVGRSRRARRTMMRPVSRKSSSSKPRIVIAGVPMRTPDATVGGRSSNGTVLRLTVICTSCRRSSAALPVHSELRRSICIRCVSVPPVRISRPPSCSVSASASAFARICRWYSRNASVIAILKHVAFAAIVCSSGPPCMPGKTARSTACACSSRQRMKPARGPGQRLVRRRGDEVAVLDRVRVQAGGDEAGEVRHVAEQERADLVGDLAELVGLDRARIRRAAADDQLRPHLLRLRAAPRRSRPSSSRARRRSRRSCRGAR